MSTKQRDSIDERHSEVESIIHDGVGDLVECHQYDPAMAELPVIEAVNAYIDEMAAADLF